MDLRYALKNPSRMFGSPEAVEESSELTAPQNSE